MTQPTIQPLRIANAEIFPGQSKMVKLPVGSLPSGTEVSIKAHVFRGFRPGPTILFLAGIHGDEINGIEIVRRCIAEKLFERIDAGSVIAIPLLNMYGFINFSRDVPDGKDVNRAFPGSATGSLASRVAHCLSREILPLINLGIDFHTGGRGTYNYPQLRYSPEDEESRKIAEVFGAPIMVASTPPGKSLRKTAAKSNLPILTYEGGENQRYDGLSLQVGVAGVKRLLSHYGLSASSNVELPSVEIKDIHKSTWMRAGRAGLFRWSKASGHHVRKGEPLGVICDPRGILPDKRVLANKDGFIIGHANAAVVSQGDAIFNIGEML
jgi:predicted deacylase